MATKGHVYDDDSAVHFVHTRTGIPESAVTAVLRGGDRYLAGLGIIAADDWPEDEPESIRAEAPVPQ